MSKKIKVSLFLSFNLVAVSAFSQQIVIGGPKTPCEDIALKESIKNFEAAYVSGEYKLNSNYITIVSTMFDLADKNASLYYVSLSGEDLAEDGNMYSQKYIVQTGKNCKLVRSLGLEKMFKRKKSD